MTRRRAGKVSRYLGQTFLLHLHEHTTTGTCNGRCYAFPDLRTPTYISHTIAVTGLYGTFLYNSERERALDAADRRTACVWPSLLRDEQLYTNSTFKAAAAESNPTARGQLRPRTGPGHLVPWEAAFTRWLTLRTPSPTPVYEL